MHARSTAIAVAVMCAAALGDARAQRLEPPTSIDFIALSGGAARCTERTVFEHALRGAPLCGDLPTARPATIEALFLNERERDAKRRVAEVAFERGEVAYGDIKETRTEAAPIQPRVEAPRVERPEEVYEAVVTATPEPASLALVASGLAGLAAYRKRRAKRSEGINN
jgi:hypothetical protein